MAEEPEGDLSRTLDRILGLLIRRRWLVLGTASTIALGTIAGLFYLPNRYTSEASIFAVQQRVPERYVVPTATSDVTQALEAMVQEVLSRPRLLGIIQELHLYPSQRTRLQPEQLIQLMRGDITVEPVERKLGRGDVNAFKVSFVANDPQLAQAVTQRLTTLFIEQNLKTRADQAESTTKFLHEQLEAAKTELQTQEQRLRDFKMQYLGELPEQQQGNLSILTSLQSQLENIMASRNHAQQQRLYLESLVNEYQRRNRRVSTTTLSSNGQIITPLQAAEGDLVRLQAERKTLLAAYTRNHPDVLRKDQELNLQKTLIETLKTAKTSPTTNEQRPNEDAAAPDEDIIVAQLRSQLQANNLELDNLAKKDQKLRVDINQYQARLNLTPVREQQLTSMQRDYELVRQHYGDLLKKKQESQLATDLEKRQEGQQFRLADPPNLPTMPSSPKRVKISLGGLVAGLLLGCALAFVVETRNAAFHTENDAAISRLGLPLLVSIPLFFTPAEEQRRSRKRALEWFAGTVVAVAVLAAEFYVYRHG
jgi:succinoglycan biosynthesis transport protein ExoP